MNKKRANTKVLVNLDGGFTIKEVRYFHTDTKTDVTKQTGSNIAVFQGKKQIKGGFKNTDAALTYYKGDLK